MKGRVVVVDQIKDGSPIKLLIHQNLWIREIKDEYDTIRNKFNLSFFIDAPNY